MFTPCGVITLTTDFGAEGPFVATMKGRILTRFPAARIIDVTHDILVHWPAEAGFWLSRSWSYFPPGSVHVAVVDPGVGTKRDIIVVTAAEHLFLAPDNGLLAPVIGRIESVTIHRLAPRALERFSIGRPSATFHGRDIFAPIAAELAAGALSARQISVKPPASSCRPGSMNRSSLGKLSGVWSSRSTTSETWSRISTRNCCVALRVRWCTRAIIASPCATPTVMSGRGNTWRWSIRLV